MKKSPITTHILDISSGKPARGVPVALLRGSKLIARAKTDADGRLLSWLPASFRPAKGVYTLVFQTKLGFYPEVRVSFRVADPKQHYHVPLLLSPYGYSTYRGS